jgi:hypothetical protein
MPREEGAPGAAVWVEISRLFLNRAVKVVGYSPTSELASGSTPDEILGGGELDLGHGIGNEGLWCYNEGRCEAVTIYLEGKDSTQARLVVMPLLATPLTFDGW